MFTFEEIGRFYCDENYRYDAPRQGVFANENEGVIELRRGKNFEQALEDLAGVERIWVIFVFDQNKNWKTKTNPPVAPNRKIGVFATRSPYRPNPIGLSCVELVRIDGLKLYIRNFDLLNNTPVLDIKPYISMADAFNDSRVAWLEEAEKLEYTIEFSELFLAQSDFIYQACNFDIRNFCQIQLSVNPLDKNRKRIEEVGDNLYEIAFRTWRISFVLFENELLRVMSIRSNYSPIELTDLAHDKYNDKLLHFAFVRKFKNG